MLRGAHTTPPTAGHTEAGAGAGGAAGSGGGHKRHGTLRRHRRLAAWVEKRLLKQLLCATAPAAPLYGNVLWKRPESRAPHLSALCLRLLLVLWLVALGGLAVHAA